MLIGHEDLIRDFKRLADVGNLAHGYVFFGPRRVGKATFAAMLANYLETGQFASGVSSPVLGDALFVGPGAGGRSLGIDAVREIKNFLSQMPNRSHYRTVILSESELLTSEAENALLKTTEEPTAHALLILVIDDPERLLPTLRSRLQAIHFGAVKSDAIERWLVEEIGVPAKEATKAAAASFGAPGLAWAAIKDERFREYSANADKFLKISQAMRKDFVKDLVDDEDFNFDDFLGAVALAAMSGSRKDPRLWHAIMELRQGENYFNLNPRLQLTALGAII